MRAHNFIPVVATSAVLLGLWCKGAQATEVTVVSSRGSVSVRQADHVVPISASAHLNLPAQISTGSDGMVDLRDNGSLVHIGPNSTVAIPDSGPAGGLIDRYLQSAGSALYNIQGRHGRPMSVETPYLVSVVKGTVFTVSVEGGATSITLMEGSLDVAAPDLSQHVLLKPNQSIRHSAGEPSLMVSPARPESALRNDIAKDVAPLTEANSSQAAFVTRDLAEVGATVSAQHALSSSALPGGSTTGPVANNGGLGGSSGSGSPSSSGGTNTTGSGSGNSSSPSSGGSTSTGTTSGTSSSTTSGSTSTAGTTSGSGSSNSSGGDSSGGTTPVIGCNGKTNGTGQGKCLGHGKT